GSLALTFYAFVVLEAAFLYRRWGDLASGGGFCVVVALLTLSGRPAFAGDAAGDLVAKVLLVLMIAAVAAAVAEHMSAGGERFHDAEQESRSVKQGGRPRAGALQVARYAVTVSVNQALSVEDGVPAVLAAVCEAFDW